jgi:SAM-dependent methyltransferase
MGVRSNSFDFTEAGAMPGFAPGGGDCPGERLPEARGPLPGVYLVRDGRTALYTTDTTSFTVAEIREISHRRQQLYVDVSDKVALDDYEQDVRQLRLLPACKACPRRDGCPSAFAVSGEVPFFREERWLRQEIERMKGRVLDIGCGDLRYRDILHRLIDGGQVEYHGLDPDPEAIARLRASRLPARLHVMDIEEFDHPTGYFDYVLMLRSLNHFRDLERTFDLVTRLLRNHGNVILTECLPFGLLRSRGKTAEARQSLVPRFEHFRNWSSEQVLEFVRRGGYPFRVNVHRPVQPKTANMWLLKLIKIES